MGNGTSAIYSVTRVPRHLWNLEGTLQGRTRLWGGAQLNHQFPSSFVFCPPLSPRTHLQTQTLLRLRQPGPQASTDSKPVSGEEGGRGTGIFPGTRMRPGACCKELQTQWSAMACLALRSQDQFFLLGASASLPQQDRQALLRKL